MEENVLTLTNTRTHAQESFQIEDELGRGGSRTAFRAKRRGKQDEPSLLVTLKRLDGDGALSEDQYERFRHCCKTHIELTNNGLANFIPAIMDDYKSQEGVRYAVTALVDGQTMDKKQFETLHEYLEVLCGLADVVAAFHRKGWLLLDIKPANILVKDGNRGVTLIDLDSLLHEDELSHDKPVLVGTSAGSGDPYLPDNVSTAADVYSLGAMLFRKILGRWPASLDRWPTARYDFEKAWGSGELTSQLHRCLTKLFRKTLTPPAMRWSMEELETALRQLAALTDPARLRLRVEKRSVQGLLGREDECKALLEMLHKPEKKPVFIWGRPGMGKSSLASEFAARHKNEFDFQIVPFAGTLRQTILNIATNDAATLQLQPDERYREIIKCLSDCDEKTVLIIDGFDAEDSADTGALRRCEEFYELLRLPVRLVFTTKFHFPRENEYDSIPVGPLKEKDLLWLMRDDDREIQDRASLRKIMTLIEQNTLVANIAGCTIRYSYGRITAAGLLDRLRAGSCDDENEVESWHNNVLQYGNMLYHLRTLFRLANMNEAAKHVLSCMCLTGDEGLSDFMLNGWASKEYVIFRAVQRLRRNEWLQYDEETKTLKMHGLVRLVCMSDESVRPTINNGDGVAAFLDSVCEAFVPFPPVLSEECDWEAYYFRECQQTEVIRQAKLLGIKGQSSNYGIKSAPLSEKYLLHRISAIQTYSKSKKRNRYALELAEKEVLRNVDAGEVSSGALSKLVSVCRDLLETDLEEAEYCIDLLEKAARGTSLTEGEKLTYHVEALILYMSIYKKRNDRREESVAAALQAVVATGDINKCSDVLQIKVYSSLEEYYDKWLRTSVQNGTIRIGSSEYEEWENEIKKYVQSGQQAKKIHIAKVIDDLRKRQRWANKDKDAQPLI